MPEIIFVFLQKNIVWFGLHVSLDNVLGLVICADIKTLNR